MYKLTCGVAERAYSHSKQQVHVTEVVSMKGEDTTTGFPPMGHIRGLLGSSQGAHLQS